MNLNQYKSANIVCFAQRLDWLLWLCSRPLWLCSRPPRDFWSHLQVCESLIDISWYRRQKMSWPLWMAMESLSFVTGQRGVETL